MTTVIGVRFRTAGKIYYFSPKDIQFKNQFHLNLLQKILMK